MVRQATQAFLALLLVAATFETSVGQAASEMEAVKAANESYYAALSARDIRLMEQVWSGSPEDVNVAPPVRPSANVGWDRIRKNYETFWATLDEFSVSMERPAIKVEGNVAWVYGIENARRKTKNGEVQQSSNFGTSIFLKRDGRWLMVFHQAALTRRDSE